MLILNTVLRACRGSSREMHYQQDDAHNQNNMNKSAGYVKCEKSQQPKNNENCGDCCKHIHTSFAFEEQENSWFPFLRVG
jgi:hypothetical protein